MEAKWTKVLDSGNRIVVKQIPEGRTWVSNRSGLKRKRFNDCKTKCTTCLKKSSLKNYSNFMESGLPNRVLFYENNEWTDFPPNVVELIREHFVLKNAAIEVKFDECHYLLDILYMIRCDLRNGVQKHIGWIDEAGGHFFPDVGTHDSGQTKSAREGSLVVQIPEGDREIKLEFQIDIGGAPVCDLEGCFEESNSPAKRIKIRRKIVVHDDDDEHIDDDRESFMKLEVAVDGARDGSEEAANRVRPVNQTLDPDTVRKTFISGMAALVGRTEVVGVTACSRHLMQTRLEIFEKQVEITRDRRGDANVKYAWLAADKDALRSVMLYGVGAGACGFSSMFQSNSGVHLSPINLPYISASKCSADQDEMQHLVLCRVILGKVEQVRPGSKQVLPSDVNFDSGVDCLQNPCRYFVWSMNTSTHISPEYIVSFRTESKAEDAHLKKEGSNKILEKAAGQVFKGEMQLHRSPDVNSPPLLNSVKAPKSPWMPFPLLFDAISKEVASKKMTVVYAQYELFMQKMITREELVSSLRMIVGDQLLRSTLLNLQTKLPQVRFQSRNRNAEASVWKLLIGQNQPFKCRIEQMQLQACSSGIKSHGN